MLTNNEIKFTCICKYLLYSHTGNFNYEGTCIINFEKRSKDLMQYFFNKLTLKYMHISKLKNLMELKLFFFYQLVTCRLPTSCLSMQVQLKICPIS